MQIDRQLRDFLRVNHTSIGDELFFVEPKRHSIYDSDEVLYESKNEKIAITIALQGAYMGWVLLRYGQQEHILFYDFFSLVKYLEWNKRNGTVPEVIMEYIAQDKEKFAIEGEPLDPTKPCDLIGYVGTQENMEMLDAGYHVPELIKIDEEVIEKDGFDKQTIECVLEKLHTGAYKRLEVTLQHAEGKESLVYLCEDGKAIVWYFSDSQMYTALFFENRNGASYIPMNKLPFTTIHGQNVREQEVVLDCSVLGAIFLELLRDGILEKYDTPSWYKEGRFSGRNFSNKNAYIKQRTEKGEFE